MSINTVNKTSRILFDERFEILFSEEQTLNLGKINVLFKQKEALLKNRVTGEILPTNIFASSEEFAELLVIEKFCNPG
jgi:hypothetical protein